MRKRKYNLKVLYVPQHREVDGKVVVDIMGKGRRCQKEEKNDRKSRLINIECL